MPIFAKQGEYEPCGIFTKEHFLLILLTIIGIKMSLKKTINKTHIHHVSEGDSLISEICWIKPLELLNLYPKMQDTPIARLVAKREYPFAKLVFDILK